MRNSEFTQRATQPALSPLASVTTPEPRAIQRNEFGDLASQPALALAHGRETASSLVDGGATHIIHPTDYGAIPGTWQHDCKRLRLGDKSFMETYGSVEKLFVVPCGGPPIRRRVLIAPKVMGMVWSHTQEVDNYRSTIVHSPDHFTITLEDGRKISAHKTPNGLRWIQLEVLPSERSVSMALMAALSPCCQLTPGETKDILSLTQRALSDTSMALLTEPTGHMHFISGVGKPRIELTDIQLLHLWHARLGHVSFQSLVTVLAKTGVLDRPISQKAIRAYAEHSCDICNAHRLKRRPTQRAIPRPWPDGHFRNMPSPQRALRPLRRVLLDIFGPVAYPSVEHGYRFLLGFYDEATGFRWAFGCKTHTAEVCEEITQLLRAALRLILGEIDIIRTDNAAEFARSERWRDYMSDCGIFKEFSVAYDARAMGGVERGWGKAVPTAGCLLSQFGTGRNHWFTAVAHAFLCANIEGLSLGAPAMTA